MKIFLLFLFYAVILQTLAYALIGLLFYSLLWFRTKPMFGFIVLCAVFRLFQSYPYKGMAFASLVLLALGRRYANENTTD